MRYWCIWQNYELLIEAHNFPFRKNIYITQYKYFLYIANLILFEEKDYNIPSRRNK